MNNSYLKHRIKRTINFVQEYKSLIIFAIAFILISDLREYPLLLDIFLRPMDTLEIIEDLQEIDYYPGKSMINLIRAFIRFIAYPLNLFVFQMEFEKARVPEIFIMLVPLVLSFTIGLIIIIMTED